LLNRQNRTQIGKPLLRSQLPARRDARAAAVAPKKADLHSDDVVRRVPAKLSGDSVEADHDSVDSSQVILSALVRMDEDCVAYRKHVLVVMFDCRRHFCCPFVG